MPATSAQPQNTHSGGCLCGAIRYQTTGAPIRITVCHCSFCQRATGSAFMVEPIFAQDQLTITSGTPATHSQASTGSGKLVHVHFCVQCGTKLYLSFERFTEAIGLYAGTFDTPGWFTIAPNDTKHIFLDSAQSGVVIPAGIPTYRQHATANDGTPITPHIYTAPHTIP